MREPEIIALSRPLNVIGTDRATLSLREPTGNDLVEAGYPLSFGTGTRTEVDAAAMTRLIGKVAGTPEVNIRMLAACDWQACCLAVMGFFAMPEQEGPPEP
jgi:hypothetical protein